MAPLPPISADIQKQKCDKNDENCKPTGQAVPAEIKSGGYFWAPQDNFDEPLQKKIEEYKKLLQRDNPNIFNDDAVDMIGLVVNPDSLYSRYKYSLVHIRYKNTLNTQQKDTLVNLRNKVVMFGKSFGMITIKIDPKQSITHSLVLFFTDDGRPKAK